MLKDGALTGTTTPGQSRPRSYSNKEILHNHQGFRTEASPADAI